MGIPVRISCGAPKWWTEPTLEYAKEVTPWGIWGKRAYEEYELFELAYKAKLEKLRGGIVREIQGLCERNPDSRLVFLCYENIARQWCHRTIFSEWLEERTGLDIPELS